MYIKTSDRGFRCIEARTYLGTPTPLAAVVRESSVIGDYPDSMENPGSSYLWVGRDHHLNREEVQMLVYAMQHWLDNKRLPGAAVAGRRS